MADTATIPPHRCGERGPGHQSPWPVGPKKAPGKAGPTRSGPTPRPPRLTGAVYTAREAVGAQHLLLVLLVDDPALAQIRRELGRVEGARQPVPDALDPLPQRVLLRLGPGAGPSLLIGLPSLGSARHGRVLGVCGPEAREGQRGRWGRGAPTDPSSGRRLQDPSYPLRFPPASRAPSAPRMPGPRTPGTHPARQSRLALRGRRSGGGSCGAGGRGRRRPRPRPRPRHQPGCPDLPTSPPGSRLSVRTASHPHVRPQARLPAVRPPRASPRFLFPAGSPGPGSAGSGRPAHTCPASGRGGAGGTRTLTLSSALPHTFSRAHWAHGVGSPALSPPLAPGTWR